MRAELRANTAVAADKRLSLIFIETDRVDSAGVHASAAANTLFRVQQNAAALARGKRAGRTNLGAVRFPARLANACYKSSLQSSAGLDMDTAFSDGMVLAVHGGTDEHAGKTPDTLINFVCPDNLSQVIVPFQRAKTGYSVKRHHLRKQASSPIPVGVTRDHSRADAWRLQSYNCILCILNSL